MRFGSKNPQEAGITRNEILVAALVVPIACASIARCLSSAQMMSEPQKLPYGAQQNGSFATLEILASLQCPTHAEAGPAKILKDGTAYFSFLRETVNEKGIQVTPLRKWDWSSEKSDIVPSTDPHGWRMVNDGKAPAQIDTFDNAFKLATTDRYALWHCKDGKKGVTYLIESVEGSIVKILPDDGYAPTSINSSGVTAGTRINKAFGPYEHAPTIRTLDGTYTDLSNEIKNVLSKDAIPQSNSPSWFLVTTIRPDGTILGSMRMVKSHMHNHVPFIRDGKTKKITLLPLTSEYNGRTVLTGMNDTGQIVGNTIEFDPRKNDFRRRYGLLLQAPQGTHGYDWSKASAYRINHSLFDVQKVFGISDEGIIGAYADFCPKGAAIGHAVQDVKPEYTGIVFIDARREKINLK